MNKLILLVLISAATYGLGRLLCTVFEHPTVQLGIMYVMGVLYGALTLPKWRD